jgi:acyl-CoA dehydrogenase
MNPHIEHPVAALDHRLILESLYTWEEISGRTGVYAHRSPADCRALLSRAAELAGKAAEIYLDGDHQGVHLDVTGEVILPKAFYRLWPEIANFWRETAQMRVRTGDSRIDGELVPAYPPMVLCLCREILLSANPALMTFCAFNTSANLLLDAHGTSDQQRIFASRIAAFDWEACFCATEQEAGSDLTATRTTAELDISSERYRIEGSKRFITSGGHSLTENTVYFVLARAKDGPQQHYALTCFIVPRYWSGDDGRLIDNGVRVEELPDKMGLRANPNPTLSFGRDAPTFGVPLGGKIGVGLLQLRSLMNGARFGAGLLALALSGVAFQRSVEYAGRRIQGRPFGDDLVSQSAPVRICEHEDVRRMLLEMRCRVDGARLLFAKSCTWYMDRAELKLAGEKRHTEYVAIKRVLEMLNPMIKAYISDQAWRVIELAIQVHGGVGYLKTLPLEAYARDVKVLSIWEGTNGIQALTLIRERLNYGAIGPGIKLFCSAVGRDAQVDREDNFWPRDAAVLRNALEALQSALQRIELRSRSPRRSGIGFFATRVLDALTEIAFAWVLLGAARHCHRLSTLSDHGGFPREFLQEKIESYLFFSRNILPHTITRLGIVCDDEATI